MQITRYRLSHKSAPDSVKLAVVADLHGEPHERVLSALQAEKPDLILIPGDLMEDHQLADRQFHGYAFLRACAALAPTFYSLGNHEVGCYHSENPWKRVAPSPFPARVREWIAETGAHLLENDLCRMGDLCICGLTSGLNGDTNAPDEQILAKFAQEEGFRILLCHHPEYYAPYIKKTSIELTVCGHAHGGQWRIFGRGVFAPGQGLFPKYTSGVWDNRCVISRGLGNHTWIPRFFNPRELVFIHLEK